VASNQLLARKEVPTFVVIQMPMAILQGRVYLWHFVALKMKLNVNRKIAIMILLRWVIVI
jgi:hypothetical protein